ncbi:S-adenosyl-L-methionine-dependent methyltransferase [Schizopora paradoxa]|uniref:S-adenosyl-L-methionine-dependent methyltransferase n=1 Tax=Schizopora paradoxa TaxID=27342 RepID=A0A0H2S4K2_9AGAM|nr:S-adenosyl-L-methionine-dependent methyltransferase [Schizopora paradoxa]
MTFTLRSLAEIILKNCDILDAALEKRGAHVPSLDDPYTPESDVTNNDPQLLATADIACRAALQLVQTIRTPQLTILLDGLSFLTSVSLRCVIELHVTEILREAGPQGMYVDEIAKKCNVDPQKLRTILRCLAGRWIFRETAPDTYTNNRFSSMLDKGKPVAELQSDPMTMYDNPQSTLAATAAHYGDEGLKGAASLFEVMTDPTLAFSGDPKDTGFSKAFNTQKSYWEFMEQPDQKARLYRFGVTMEGLQKLEPPELAVIGYDWGKLRDGAVVVDVGGGVGTVSAQLSEAFPKLHIVVQDRLDTIEDGKKRWKELKRTGQVTFQAHDFLTPNPIKNPDVFLMRYITHDWADDYVKTMLHHLREAAGPNTRLVIMDRIVPYTCSIPKDKEGVQQFTGLVESKYPPPVTIATPSNFAFGAGVMMLLCINGQERTIKQFDEVFASAGWKIDSVVQHEGSGALPSTICAVPI